MRVLLLAAVAAAALAPSALASGAPTPAAVSASLTPAVNALAAKGGVSWRFARAVCVREATPGRYLCTSAHVRAGVPVDAYSDAWEVVSSGGRLRYGPATVCPLPSGRCVNTDFSPLTPG